MNVLDLFSGIGGFSLGLERAGMRTIGFCEIDPYCRRVLAKHWPDVPCHEDIRTFNGTSCDLICGGFPCQDLSVAGRGAGLAGKRSGLWSHYARILRLVKPRYAIVENVSGLLSRGLGELLADLATLGYDAEWHCIPAASLGAAHQRDRVWIVAYARGKGLQERFLWRGISEETRRHDYGEDLALDAPGTPAPTMVRGLHGVSNRVDRIRALGNAVVPQVVEVIGRAIMRFEHEQQPSH